MYQMWQSHVKVLTASVRRIPHILYALQLGSYAITIPYKLFLEWKAMGFHQPLANFKYLSDTKLIPYQALTLKSDWRKYKIKHELTEIGVKKFAQDWSAIIKP